MNYFDVSPYYGRTKAETVLGKALKGIPRDQFVLSTKVGRYDVESFDFSAERVTRSVDESMDRLGVDHLDIVLCHDIEFGNIDQIVTETIPALHKLKDAGKIKAVGFSGYPLEIFPYVVTASAPGSIDVVLSYCNYTIQNDRLGLITDGLKRAGVGIINASALCMGLLTPSGGMPWHPAQAEVKQCTRKALDLCNARGKSLPRTAMQFALQGDFASTLVGIESTQTLQLNLDTLLEPIDNDFIQEVREVFTPVRNHRWESGFVKAYP